MLLSMVRARRSLHVQTASRAERGMADFAPEARENGPVRTCPFWARGRSRYCTLSSFGRLSVLSYTL